MGFSMIMGTDIRCLRINRFDALRKAREWVASLHQPKPLWLPQAEAAPPRYPVDDLLALVNPDIRKPFDMREVLLRIVDDSRLSIFKPKYGKNLITALAQIIGQCLSTMHLIQGRRVR